MGDHSPKTGGRKTTGLNLDGVYMESRFRQDFSGVRVHTDGKAADAVNASGYTVGRNVVFAARKYAPNTEHGQQLLAHELTHVLQQSTNMQSLRGSLEVTNPRDSAEQEADNSAKIIAQKQPMIPSSLSTSFQLARQPSPSSSPPQPGQKYLYYDRSNFDNKFDAEVQPVSHLVTLIIGLKFESSTLSDDKINAFQRNFQATVEQIWSYQYTLVCMGDRFRARVRILTNAANPHAIISLRPDDQFPSSTSKYPNASQYKESDNLPQEKRQRVQESGKSGKVKERTFYQTTSAHEFGHLIGLHDTYGNVITREQATDIMGVGSYVSPKDYEPFVKIMNHYGRDALPPTDNKWRVEAAD